MAKFAYDEVLIDFLAYRITGFDWDDGNLVKSKVKHKVTPDEAEEIFYDSQLTPLGKQISPVVTENRFGVIGKTYTGRILFASFTIRNNKIRIISCRAANENERKIYDEEIC